MKISSLFNHGMVLQRKHRNLVWGYGKPDVETVCRLGETEIRGRSQKSGYFEMELPKMDAGGPYELYISAGEERYIQDVMVGDVILLGGQSNMELPIERTMELFEKELEGTSEPWIRMFTVPKEFDFQQRREDLREGQWIKAVGKELWEFSAVGYFAAIEIKREKGIPIGLIQTAVGGTPVKSWCSEKTIRKIGTYVEELEECKIPSYPEKIMQYEGEREEAWLKTVSKAFEEKGKKKGTVEIPGIWTEGELSSFHGGICLKKTLLLEEDYLSQQKTQLVLGAVIDADKVMVNGITVGETGYKYPPRYYPIPEGILHSGENIIEIHMMVFRETGGFMPGKQYGIRTGTGRECIIDLSGKWEYEIVKTMDELPEMTFFQYAASGLYNGMIFPLRKWKIACVLFYQGESNTGNPAGYAKEMEAMISDWRCLWREPQLPFFYVQLAGFSDGRKDSEGISWALLRQQQEQVLEIPNTGMAVAYDVGEYNDLHPMDKKTVGQRLALLMKKILYGQEVVCCGPVLWKWKCMENKVRLSFPAGQRIKAGNNSDEKNEVLQGFELCGRDGVYVSCQAEIEGKDVVVWSSEIEEPKGVRYAWKDCPIYANLYNEEGLPALPFWREWGQEK